MNFVRIPLPSEDQVPHFIPIAAFTGKLAEYNAKRYAHTLSFKQQVITSRDVCRDGTTWAVYVPEEREAKTAPAGVSTPGDILGDIFYDPPHDVGGEA